MSNKRISYIYYLLLSYFFNDVLMREQCFSLKNTQIGLTTQIADFVLCLHVSEGIEMTQTPQLLRWDAHEIVLSLKEQFLIFLLLWFSLAGSWLKTG